MSLDKVEEKRHREQKMIAQMIKLYCKKNHRDGNSEGFCDECKALLEYSQHRSECCPFMESKTFCSNCKVHCYSTEMRDRIRKVMRFSGPRMILYHPITCLWHGISGLKNKKK